MNRSSLKQRARSIALALLAVAVSGVMGAAAAGWALGDVDGFYMNPVDRYRTPGYGRRQPVADSFWQTQDARAASGQPAAASIATSAQPAYRSASGS